MHSTHNKGCVAVLLVRGAITDGLQNRSLEVEPQSKGVLHIPRNEPGELATSPHELGRYVIVLFYFVTIQTRETVIQRFFKELDDFRH